MAIPGPARERDTPAEPGVSARLPPGVESAGELYQLIVNSVRDYAIFALDARGRIITWNPGAERLKGYRAHEIMGRHFSAFYPDEDVARGKPAHELRVAAEYGRFEDEGWRLRKDGSRFWANVVITAMRRPDGTLVGFSKVTRDLTDRRQNEEALRQSEEKFRLLVEGVQDYAIFLLDPEGHVQSWNRGAERLKGYRASEIVGESFEKFFPAEDLAANKPKRELETAIAEGRYEEEGWRVRKDGSRFWANVVITTLRDPETGRLLGFAKVTRDLTARKRAEQGLIAAYKDMESFSYTASHDLRAPLRAILSLAEHTLSDDPSLSAVSRENLTAIAQSTERAASLIEHLLEFARLSTGELDLRPIDVGELAREVDAELRKRYPDREVEFTIEGSEPLAACGDPDLVRILLTNLMENAWKFTRPKKQALIRLGSAGRVDGLREFYLADNGVGFDPALAARMFRPFQRYHSSAEFAGTGIGLATVRRIAEKHGGDVSAQGKLGEGARFTFSLPEEQN